MAENLRGQRPRHGNALSAKGGMIARERCRSLPDAESLCAAARKVGGGRARRVQWPARTHLASLEMVVPTKEALT